MVARVVTYLLDSVIVIDHLNGVEPATRFLEEHGATCVLSVITRAETLAGCDAETNAPVRALLNFFDCLPVTAVIADRAADLRRHRRWKLPDAIQAAVAIEHNLVLVTRNTRDFEGCRIPPVHIPYHL